MTLITTSKVFIRIKKIDAISQLTQIVVLLLDSQFRLLSSKLAEGFLDNTECAACYVFNAATLCRFE